MNKILAAPEKTYVMNFVERNKEALATLSDAVFYFAELGMQEFETAGLMTSLLEEHGFSITKGISGFPTAFLAEYGSGDPVIAIHTEYDANPGNSQVSGVTERAEIVPGAPGHCEGHNVNAAVLVCGAIALRHAMEKYKLPGRLKIFGAPAEEILLSRPYFVRDGYFDDVDLAFHDHLGGDLETAYGLMQAAMVSAEFTFRGETAHAAMNPWKGRDALDAVVLMDMGMAQYREHFQPGMTAHRVITDGGAQPNVIPAEAAIWWYFRHPNAEGAGMLFEQAKKIAQGAAMMANCELSVDVKAAVWPVRGNRTMAEVIERNMHAIGMPHWTPEEMAFAEELQRKGGVKVTGMPIEPTTMSGPQKQIAASNDSGDVSWKVPMGRVRFPSNIPHIPFHHWSAGAALATSIAHKGAVVGAQALAASVIDFLVDPGLVAAAKESFRREIGDTVYKPLLPMDQKPLLDQNAATMARYRPEMEKHYIRERPVFRAD